MSMIVLYNQTVLALQLLNSNTGIFFPVHVFLLSEVLTL